MNTLRLSLLIGLAAVYAWGSNALAQSDLEAKAAMIDGLAAYRAGSSTADSLLALGITHSELAAVAEYNLGRSLVQSGDTARAQAAFRKAIGGSDDPKLRSNAWHNLGNLSLQEQALEPAIQAYKQALRENPENEAARYNLAYAMRLAQQQPPQQEQQNDQQEQDEQEQEQDSEQEQNNDQEQEGEQEQDGEQEGQQDGDQEQDGEQDGKQEGDQDGEQEGDQEQEGESGQEGEQDQQAPNEPVEGQISPEDMERILESLERNEAAIQAKLQRQRGGGTPRKIEKDW